MDLTAPCPTSRKRSVPIKFATDRPLADPEKAARKLLEIANAAEAVQDGRIHIELINLPFLRDGGSIEEYRTGLETAITRGWLIRHRSGVYVKFTQSGADLFA
jgi:hypothetical protein